MAFFSSTPPDITEALPFAVSESLSGAFGAAEDFDVSIGGLGFLVRPNAGIPYQRSTEPIRKQQFDTSVEPGEQSLSSWWTRSQSSWDMGAGIRYYEPGTEPETRKRFSDSRGVNVWTPGQLTLLHELGEFTAPAEGRAVVAAGTEGFALACNTSISWVEGTPDAPVISSASLGGGDATQPVVVGRTVYVGRFGGVDAWDRAGTVTEVCETSSLDAAARVWFAKARLIVADGNALFWLPPDGGDLLQDGVLLFEHPSPEWRWDSVTEVGGAVLASGHSEGTSEIYRFTVVDEEGVPTLAEGSGTVTAIMPPGEAILCMGVYLGSILVLGTSDGVRVGQVSDDGAVRYGPLSVELEHPPTDIAFAKNFAWLSTRRGDSAAALRVDVSAPVDEAGRFAWAWDVEREGYSSGASSIAIVQGRVVLGAGGTALGETDLFVEEGWLDTGRIRFGTTEEKAFRYARLISTLAGEGSGVGLDAITPDDNRFAVVRMDRSFSTDQDVAVMIPGKSTHSLLSLVVLLRASDDRTESPLVTGVSLKAVPAPTRVRLVSLPLSVFDREADRYGNHTGYPGAAAERLAALERAEETSTPVRFVDNRTGEAFVAQIEAVEFQSTAPPDGPESGFGGIAVVLLRRL